MVRITIVLLAAVLGLEIGIFSYFVKRSSDGPRILGRYRNPDGSQSVELLSSRYTLDREYKSMRGPRSNQPRIRMSNDAASHKTIWLTGVETEIVDAKRMEKVSNEFFCHSNLTLNPDTTTPQKHNSSFDRKTHVDWRLFTLIPGRMEIHLPSGYGVPLKNDTLLDYFTMSLNQNPGQPNRNVRMRSRITYRTQAAHASSLQPLFCRPLYIYQQHKKTVVGVKKTRAFNVHGDHVGETCSNSCAKNQAGATPSSFANAYEQNNLNQHPGSTCCVASASPDGIVEQFGAENTMHWMVPCGKHRYRTEVTQQMSLPFNTTAHYVTGHLHPFGKWLKLVEIDSQQTVLEITSRDFSDRLGVEHISEIKSQTGIPIRKDRRYELITEYDNRSNEPIDAMAILYLFLYDGDRD